MILDFNYPTLTAKGWCVKVHKTTKDNKLYVQKMTFEDKNDAFAFYNQTLATWRKSRSR
jgi:hypothetical protein